MDAVKQTKVGSVLLRNVVCTHVTPDNENFHGILRHRVQFKFDAASGVPGRLLHNVSELFPDLPLFLSDESKEDLYVTDTVHRQTSICVFSNTNVISHTPEGREKSRTISTGRQTLHDLRHEPLIFRASVNLLVTGVVVYETLLQEDRVGVVSFSSAKISEVGNYRPWVVVGVQSDQSQFDVNHARIMSKLNDLKGDIHTNGNDKSTVITGG